LGDQKYFVSDTNKALHDFSWQPNTSIKDGLKKLVEWLGLNLTTY
jgi:nucleoside-diphosphate-sugar epimerase